MRRRYRLLLSVAIILVGYWYAFSGATQAIDDLQREVDSLQYELGCITDTECGA